MLNQPQDIKSRIWEEFGKAKQSKFGGKQHKTIKIQQIPQGYLAKFGFHCYVYEFNKFKNNKHFSLCLFITVVWALFLILI